MAEADSPPPFPHRLSTEGAYVISRGTWRVWPIRSTRIELPGTGEAAKEARRAAALHLGGVVDDLHLRDVQLLVSELVTNAVLHGEGRSGVVMFLAASAVCVRVEVCDSGAGFNFSNEPKPERVLGGLGGLGLRIMDMTASRWGVAGDEGTCVWFEIDLA